MDKARRSYNRAGSIARSDALARNFAAIAGAVFLLVGILGFIPGITTNYDTMQFAGPDSGARLLGVFKVSVLHNIVHLLFGVAGLAMSRTAAAARAFLIGGGVVYLLLWLYGLLVDKSSDANFVPLNSADDWLHFVLGAGLIGLGLLTRRRGAVTPPAA
jgi:amino acid permease